MFLFFGTGQSRKLDMNKGKRVPKTSTKQNRGRGLGRGHVEDLPMQVDNHPVEEQPDAPLTSPMEDHPFESQSDVVHSSVRCK